MTPTRATRLPDGGGRELRILAIGDCNTSGTRHPDEPNPETCVPSRLAQRLERDGLRCTLQNLGYPMATTREGVTRTERDGRPADVVLINFGLVDAWITSIPAIYIPYYPDNFARKQLRKVLKSVKRRLRSPLARRFVPVGPVVPLAEYLHHMCRLVNLSRTRQPGVCVMLWGTAPALEQPERTASIECYNDSLRQLAGELKVPFVDTAALIADLAPQVAYRDQTHLNDVAAERIVSAMAAAYLAHADRCREQRVAA